MKPETKKIVKEGSALTVLGVMALLASLGLQSAYWCQATGDVVTGGTIDPQAPWLLSDGEQTLSCEMDGVKYSWQTCTVDGGCDGVVRYCEEVYIMGNQVTCKR